MIATTTALVTVAIVASLAAAGIGAYSAIQQADIQGKTAKFNQQVALNDALAKRQQSSMDAQRVRDRNLRVLGSSKAAVAKNGIDLSGSATDVITDSQTQGEMDRLLTMYRGDVGANASQSEALLDNYRAQNADGSFAAAGSLLGGIGSATGIYGNYMNGKRGMSTNN